MALVDPTWRRLLKSHQAPSVATPRVVAATTGVLFLVGALLVLMPVWFDPGMRGAAYVWAICIAAVGCSIANLVLRARIRRWMSHAFIFTGTCMISAAALVSSGVEPRTAYVVYLFVVVDAAFFFSLRGLAAHGLSVLAATSLVGWRNGMCWEYVVVFDAVCAVVGCVIAWLGRAADEAELDPLTDLTNRRGLEWRLEQALQEAASDGGSLSVVLLDLDGFKGINDSLGHEAGDALLRACAEAWRRIVPDPTLLSRHGGDEFAVCVPGASAAKAADLADRLRAAVPVGVTVSAGVAAWTPGDSLSVLFGRADVALYDAKVAGRDQTAVYGDPERAAAEIEEAIQAGQMVLHFQPIVDLVTREIVSGEALIRWDHPERGLVPPDAFIPMAERTGAIHSLGVWVLDEACRQAVAAPHHLPRVSVNVSVHELRRAGYADRLRTTLQVHGLAPGRLAMEVTEAVFDDGDEQVVRSLREVRELGVRIAIDDFGSGYSSLRWLDRMPVDTIKIDGDFLDRVDEKTTDVPILEAILAMTRALGVRSVVERVETEHQATLLRDLGCDLGQGYLFGRPGELRVPHARVPADDEVGTAMVVWH